MKTVALPESLPVEGMAPTPLPHTNSSPPPPPLRLTEEGSLGAKALCPGRSFLVSSSFPRKEPHCGRTQDWKHYLPSYFNCPLRCLYDRCVLHGIRCYVLDEAVCSPGITRILPEICCFYNTGSRNNKSKEAEETARFNRTFYCCQWL